jgi:uncharacterized RmlC-like cupin family protein
MTETGLRHKISDSPVAVNRGSTPAVLIGARNEPTAQESVVMYPEMDARVP